MKKYIQPDGDGYAFNEFNRSFRAPEYVLRARDIYTSSQLFHRYNTIRALVECALGQTAMSYASIEYKKRRKQVGWSSHGSNALASLQNLANVSDKRKVKSFSFILENEFVKYSLKSNTQYTADGGGQVVTGMSAAAAGIGISFFFPPAGIALAIAGASIEMNGLRKTIVSEFGYNGLALNIKPQKKYYDLRTAEKYQALCETIGKLKFKKSDKAVKTLAEKVRAIDERSPVEDMLAKKRQKLAGSIKQSDTKISDLFK